MNIFDDGYVFPEFLPAQRRPRERDNKYLAFLREKPCCACGRPGTSDPAHIRMSPLWAQKRYGKRPTGGGEKPDDRWAVPLCRSCHDEQHRGEIRFWRDRAKNPFEIARELYRICGSTPTTRRPKPRTKIFNRGFQKGIKRPIPSRPFPARHQ